MTELHVPEVALVLLIGPSGSGKSTFAARHFAPTEVVSSDRLRAAVSDDETDRSATVAAFEVLHVLVRKRLERGLLTVIDATIVHADTRKPLLALAREHHVSACAVVLDVPLRVCVARNAARGGVPDHVVRSEVAALRRSLPQLNDEGFRFVRRFDADTVDDVRVVRVRRRTDGRHVGGPFDLVGDIHGCHDELCLLMDELGWVRTRVDGRPTARHPDGRQLVFVGDLVDRGPDSPAVLELVMNLVEDGVALCVSGNHDAKLLRVLRGASVKPTHGLAETLDQLTTRDDPFRARVAGFLDGLVSHLVLDEGRLVVAHAGLPEAMHNRSSGRVREFAMYGDTNGEIDEYGLPVRLDWAAGYRGRATVVHGHVPMVEAEWHNNTIDLDTGCCFGGKLTALRYPERELVSVPAARVYYAPIRPLAPPPAASRRTDDTLDVDDVLGRHAVETRLAGRIGISEPNAAASLEGLRLAVDPRWLIHLPPTLAPPPPSRRPGLVEHPDEAFDWFREAGVDEVVCAELPAGERAVVLVCRDAGVAAERFGVDDGSDGIAWTRHGRRLLAPEPEAALLRNVRAALDGAGTWERLDTGWVLLDAAWTADPPPAPVAAAALAATEALVDLLGRANARGAPVHDLLANARERAAAAGDHARATRPSGRGEPALVPFHLLASEGHVHVDRDHRWHLEEVGRLVGPGIRRIGARFLDPSDAAARDAAAAWWETQVAAGADGVVVKPVGFVVRGPRGLVQPGLVVRGAPALLRIGGPELLRPDRLFRLRQRSLATRRQLAVRELALGVESLERFVRREPRWRVHQAVAAVLALEAEPVDTRP